MHIFIDESGTFAGLESQTPAVSVQGALILADAKLDRLYTKYGRLRQQLPKRNGEVKGSLLDEKQVVAVIDLLRRNKAIFAASFFGLRLAATAALSRGTSNSCSRIEKTRSAGMRPSTP